MPDESKTIVIFRKWKGEHDDILALFPEIDAGECQCQSYLHIGQHGGADYQYCIRSTVPATPEEYKDLKEELEKIGYNLIIRKRYTRKRLTA